MFSLSESEGSALARVAVDSVCREYPHKLDHVLTSQAGLQTPRSLHGAFYGSYDWHSAVHNHWLLAYVLRRWPQSEGSAVAAEVLSSHLTHQAIDSECRYFGNPDNSGSERPYGWVWLLRLDTELSVCPAPDGRSWREALRPLSTLLLARYVDYIRSLPFPIHHGRHQNTAFSMRLMLEVSDQTGNRELAELLSGLARSWYADSSIDPHFMTSSWDDFLCPALTVGDLMARVLDHSEFLDWLEAYMPTLGRQDFAPRRGGGANSDRPPSVTFDGQYLSRAWCLTAIADALGEKDPRHSSLKRSSEELAGYGLQRAITGNFLGDHWLPTFACYLDARLQPDSQRRRL